MVRPAVTCAKDLTPERVQWFIDGIIPTARLSILDGDPGQGKSLVSLQIAAGVTRGQLLTAKGLEKTGSNSPANVVLMNGEDDARSTILPRLRLFNAAPSRVFLLSDIAGLGPTDAAIRSVYFPHDTQIVRQVL